MTGKAIIPMTLAAALMLSSCGGKKEEPTNAANAVENAANSLASATDALANATNAVAPAHDFSRYVGKYPFDKVDGHSWDSDPAVIAAVTAAIADKDIRKTVLEAEGPSAPIELSKGKILSWACEAHNCGPHNWTTMIDPATGAAEVCYYDEEAAPGKSRWFRDGKDEVRAESCPQGSGG